MTFIPQHLKDNEERRYSHIQLDSRLLHTSPVETAVCFCSAYTSLVVKLHSPEVVWASDRNKTCPSHPSLPGRLPSSGGTAVWAVTPACQSWPLHLLLGW